MKKSVLTCLAAGLLFAQACDTGSSSRTNEKAQTRKSGATSNVADARVPAQHRPQAVACSQSVAPGSRACTADTDCSCGFSLAPARCIIDATGNGSCTCDQCLTDDECGGGSVCSCQGATFGWAHQSWGNVCVSSNCNIDDDCGPGSYCSPTVSSTCGSFFGVQGYYCHSSADVCIDDSDCPAPGYCAFAPESGQWVCGSGFCAG